MIKKLQTKTNFNLAFFSSSGFTIPILESILHAQNYNFNLGYIFIKQLKKLQQKVSSKQIINAIPSQFVNTKIPEIKKISIDDFRKTSP